MGGSVTRATDRAVPERGSRFARDCNVVAGMLGAEPQASLGDLSSCAPRKELMMVSPSLCESDDGAKLRAQQALKNSSVYALRGLAVQQIEQRLLISGRVTSFYHKQQAQELVRAVAGGLLVVNSVEVSSS